jgi:hypothetical protein
MYQSLVGNAVTPKSGMMPPITPRGGGTAMIPHGMARCTWLTVVTIYTTTDGMAPLALLQMSICVADLRP